MMQTPDAFAPPMSPTESPELLNPRHPHRQEIA